MCIEYRIQFFTFCISLSEENKICKKYFYGFNFIINVQPENIF